MSQATIDRIPRSHDRRYILHVRVVRPTTELLARMYFARFASRVGYVVAVVSLGPANSFRRYLRWDSLAMMLTRSNVRSGSRVLCADTTLGLVSAALLERLGGLYARDSMPIVPHITAGSGLLVQIHAADAPSVSAIEAHSLGNLDGVFKSYAMMYLDEPFDEDVGPERAAGLKEFAEKHRGYSLVHVLGLSHAPMQRTNGRVGRSGERSISRPAPSSTQETLTRTLPCMPCMH